MKLLSLAAASLLALMGGNNQVACYPMPRSQAPDFANVNAVAKKAGESKYSFSQLSLSDYKGKWVVIVFYPLDFTYVCPTELIAFSEKLQTFKEIGAEVLGISVDSHFTHLAWLNTPKTEGGLGGSIGYPLLADISKDISKKYGVLVTDKDDPLRGISIRGVFILDPKHVVRSVFINDEAVGRNVDEIIRTIKGYQHADKHGEVCPANWKPGDKTIKPDQIKKMEFFSQVGGGKAESKFPEKEPTDTSKFVVTRLNEGTPGGKHPSKGQRVTMHYTGKLMDGSVFDSSVQRNQPFVFNVGIGQVIKCWEEGVPMLTKGQKAIFNCPPDYAYGSRGAGGVIPPNATLKFEVELLDF